MGANGRYKLRNGETLPEIEAEEQNDDKKELAEVQVAMEVCGVVESTVVKTVQCGRIPHDARKFWTRP